MITHRVTKANYCYPLYSHPARVEVNAPLIASKLYDIFNNAKIGLVCTGTSGIMIAQSVWMCLPHRDLCSIHYIRKSTESAHGGSNTYATPDILVVVDDFISTGATLHSIAKKLSNLQRNNVKAISIQATVTEVSQFALPHFPNLNHLIS